MSSWVGVYRFRIATIYKNVKILKNYLNYLKNYLRFGVGEVGFESHIDIGLYTEWCSALSKLSTLKQVMRRYNFILGSLRI